MLHTKKTNLTDLEMYEQISSKGGRKAEKKLLDRTKKSDFEKQKKAIKVSDYGFKSTDIIFVDRSLSAKEIREKVQLKYNK